MNTETGIPVTHAKTIALDFDGVIHSYTSPWTEAYEIHDPPVEGAIDFIRECQKEGWNVAIFSSRSHQWQGKSAMKNFLLDNGMSRKEINQIDFPDHKPPCVLFIDDRGYQFNGKFPSIDEISSFRPWNKR